MKWMKCISWGYGFVGGLIIGSSISGLGWIEAEAAEIVTDSSLRQPSRVTSAGKRTVITAGTRRGGNLFHSFRQFSIAPGETASFQGIDQDITNLFVRVTGGEASRIHGTIEVLQSDQQVSNADLFLINPNGIIFGNNAALRLGGSFIATTAERINFADGTQFSTSNPQASPLLTVSTPVGLQFGHRPGAIVNQSTAANQLGGLNGTAGQTLALIGGEVRFAPGSRMTTNGGRVEIGSVAQAGQVTLTPIVQGWDVGYGAVENFGNVQFLISSQVDTSGIAAGAIQIQARRVEFLQYSASLFSETLTQVGGDVEVNATDVIQLTGILSEISTSTLGNGRAGDVLLSAPRLVIREGARVGSLSKANGRAGDVRVIASELIRVADNATEPSLQLDDRLSLLYTQTLASGRAGNIHLVTRRLRVQSGGQISANTFGSGRAGNMDIQAREIELSGVALDNVNDQPLLNQDLPVSGGLFVGTSSRIGGDGGTLNIQTQRLVLRDGAVLQATTYGRGDAGNVNIRADESIEVSGTSTAGSFPARIIATSGGSPGLSTARSRRATGRGGNLNLTTDILTVRNQGAIAVNSLNPGSAGAGTIRIAANQIFLSNQGQLNAQTESGRAAAIRLEGVDLLVMRRNSDISTQAGLNSGGGDGGTIQVDADFIIDTPTEDSDIAADAGEGNGGNIRIEAKGILGITAQERPTPQSDITASSESGVAGEIQINTSTLDPTQGLVALPSNVVDVSRLIVQGCGIEQPDQAASLGELVITGRGGLPASSSALRSSEAVIANWATLTAPARTAPTGDLAKSDNARREDLTPPEGLSEGTAPSTDLVETAPTRPLLEAQGWIRRQDGKVELVTSATRVIPNATTQPFSGCSEHHTSTPWRGE